MWHWILLILKWRINKTTLRPKIIATTNTTPPLKPYSLLNQSDWYGCSTNTAQKDSSSQCTLIYVSFSTMSHTSTTSYTHSQAHHSQSSHLPSCCTPAELGYFQKQDLYAASPINICQFGYYGLQHNTIQNQKYQQILSNLTSARSKTSFGGYTLNTSTTAPSDFCSDFYSR